MDLPKVAACCADTAFIVRVTAFPLAVTFPSFAKEYIIHHPTMDFPKVAASGTGW